MTKILIVEDEKAIAEVEKAYVLREGYEADIASDGAEALRMFNEGNYDLVLLDLMLPGIKGERVCEEIRAVSSAPIIMITAKSGEDDVIAGLDAGADDYVAKPFRLAELLAALQGGAKTAADLLPVLFKRPLDLHQTTFAMGESIAHLNHLWLQGRIERRSEGGFYRFALAA